MPVSTLTFNAQVPTYEVPTYLSFWCRISTQRGSLSKCRSQECKVAPCGSVIALSSRPAASPSDGKPRALTFIDKKPDYNARFYPAGGLKASGAGFDDGLGIRITRWDCMDFGRRPD